eukprot:CAMPEP_0184695258 /NCGR_PEP_ID=MMETSP0313-20130426/2954_1 /TAXON_ID=2792 /ORGANISM="Porphyridium aerugineum, Strain SAG 1380-2" /LENGTH=388 /DNA_ID=CAMNT_0027153689 /DNA_START=171 /DNA_END=1337 /DNA_ORIENTATION=+
MDASPIPQAAAAASANPNANANASVDSLSSSSSRSRSRSLNPFDKALQHASAYPLKRNPLEQITTIQVNIGLTCNQACTHCHVASSPARKETMSRAVADKVLDLLASSPHITTLDITGGAPEMHDQFTYLVTEARKLQKHVMDRCNLTILNTPGMENLANFLATHQVHIVASLPCYTSANVNAQRGDSVFEESILALQKLNALGYGHPGTGLLLDLVYNPVGPFLPPNPTKLEVDYKQSLRKDFGIVFNSLYTITNMPIKRFLQDLKTRPDVAVTDTDGNVVSSMSAVDAYQDLLVRSFNPQTIGKLMCQTQVHVAYDGTIYDCDFNYALDLPSRLGNSDSSVENEGRNVLEYESVSEIVARNPCVVTAKHCLGCTAGVGSSCGGALI